MFNISQLTYEHEKRDVLAIEQRAKRGNDARLNASSARITAATRDNVAASVGRLLAHDPSGWFRMVKYNKMWLVVVRACGVGVEQD